MATIRAHLDSDRPIGLNPSSLRCSVLDLDEGDPEALWDAARPFASYTSWSGRGEHGWYGDHVPRINGKWSACGASGDVRSRGGGFVALPHGAEITIADNLHDSAAHPFPEQLVLTPCPQPASKARTGRVKGDASLAGHSWNLATVAPGQRNVALFHNLNRWAYRQGRGGDFAAWASRIQGDALRMNGLFPDPLHHAEVAKISGSVSRRVWEHTGKRHGYDHSPEAQRRRQARQVELRRMWNAERDDRILRAHDGGQSIRQIAAIEGMSPSGIWKILKRN